MRDMTTGSPMKQILVFMIPVLLGNLFQNFYNIVDIIIVGRFLGVDALAAVGMTSSIMFLVVGWITGMTTGFGILLAQAFGARDDSRLRHYTVMAAYISGAFAVVMTIGLTVANPYILRMMNTPDNIFADTQGYIGAIYAGLTATILYNLLAAIARALGDSKTPLYFLVFSSVLNIGLDLLFVGILPFGVAGAGYATVVAQSISATLCLIYITRKYPQLHPDCEERRIKGNTILKLLGMGIPMGLQFSITAIGTMIVQTSLNLLGSIYIAAYAASCKLQTIIMQFGIAIGAALSNFAGQNYGAGRIDRVKQGVRAATIISCIYHAIAMLLGYFVFPSMVILFAEDTTGELVLLAEQVFHTALWCYIPLGMIFIYRNTLQGLGNGFVPMLGGVFELLARAIVITLLFQKLQFTAICLADPLAWVFALIPLIPYYYWYMRKINRRSVEV